MTRIALVTDAWHPQVNGVVTTLGKIGDAVRALGHEVLYITPDCFPTAPCPTYPSIRLAILPRTRLAKLIGALKPDAIHIATEGPIGHAARAYCKRQELPFTTSYHTQFPEYLRLRMPIPMAWSYAYLRRFHNAAARTLVATPSLKQHLHERGFSRLVLWSRGVDTILFRPRPKDFIQAPRPVFMYAGRVAVEKNIRAFLDLDLPGSKFVVGDGPDLGMLRDDYPEVHFTGHQQGERLASTIAAADVFVFPSRTDTFGLVMLEAMASGIPVAAFPVMGPIDVVKAGITGVLSGDLRAAALEALKLDSTVCVKTAQAYSWQRCTEMFLGYLAPISTSHTNAVAQERHATLSHSSSLIRGG
jgi:glycosyltransferase involved in cell wall biosynthesis